MRIYGYLRASTKDQNASRARLALENFVESKGQAVSAWFEENESGATLKRPELFRLLGIAQRGDALLIEQVDRISRLNAKDWLSLKSTILNKGIRIIALDLPTSHQMIQSNSDAFTDRILEAVNGMLLDMLAATARKDYDDRRRRQAEGIATAKAEGKYRGRKVNINLHESIAALLRSKQIYGAIQKTLGCSRSTIAKVKNKIAADTRDNLKPCPTYLHCSAINGCDILALQF
ncbi:MAG: recombinase family protein [Pseudomonadota bacterium]